MSKPLSAYLETLATEITRQDRADLQRSLKNPRAYHNPNALGLMLAAHERLQHAVGNAANLDSADRDNARMLAHQICTHFTNTPPARKVVQAIAKDYALTWEAWAGWRDAIVFRNGIQVKS